MIHYPDRVTLARLPTPIEKLERLSRQLGIELWCKRDDLTGSTLTGNKIRKLEFLLAEAKSVAADTVVTCGGEQSNHCRATAIAARQLGIDAHLLLRTDDPAKPPPPEANILLDRIVGSTIQWVTRDEYRHRADLFKEVESRLGSSGRRPYLIPEGGSNALGAWGYISCVEELATQLPKQPFTLVYAAGSGGTGAGLILGVKLLRLPWRVVGINVCDDRDYFVGVIGEIVEQAIRRWKLDVTFDRTEIEIVDGYVGLGYAKSSPAELRSLIDLARLEGVILDPVYTGKAFHGMSRELERDRSSFGSRVVFIHTGGIFGLFPKATELSDLLPL